MSSFWRRRPKTPAADPQRPLGVILHLYRQDLAIPCEVYRDPSQDRRGQVAWVAVPVEPVAFRPDDVPGRDYDLTATIMPDDAVLILPAEDYTEYPADDVAWLPDVW